MATKSWSTLALGLVVFVVLLAYVQAQPYDDHLGKLNRNFPTKIQILMNLKLLKKMYEILILTTFGEFEFSRSFWQNKCEKNHIEIHKIF